MPRKFKKRRMMTGTNGEGMGWEEYYDYQFPDDETKPANLKILEMAQKWKQKASATGDAESSLSFLKLGAGAASSSSGTGDESRGTKRARDSGVVAGGGEEEIDLEDFEDGAEAEGEAGPESSKRRLNEDDGRGGEEGGGKGTHEEGEEEEEEEEAEESGGK